MLFKLFSIAQSRQYTKLSGTSSLTPMTPIMIYSNADTDKLRILSDNKNKAGIYQWQHVESGKIYVGSAFDLSKRVSNYYSIGYLARFKTSHIHNALLHHGYSAFSLTIFEFVDISNLPKEKARKLILEREQFHIDSLGPEYNINPIAGSRLGSKASAETKALISGDNHPRGMLGKTHSEETRVKISKALSGDNHPRYGKLHLAGTVAKISAAKGGGIIFVYDSKGSLFNTFSSAREAGKFFNCSHNTIKKYANNGDLFKEQWNYL
jgi:group I intron endonuclease